MGFLAPLMLLGSVAATIPIAIHFFFRSRYRTVPWAAMKFLLASIEQTSRRLKFQELLLLLMRVALLVLLAVALARPLSSSVGGGSGRDAIDAAFVIDNSMSMGVREQDKIRLDLAKSAALSALDHLPPFSTVQILTCSDTSELLGPRQANQIDQAREIIKNIELTHQATDLEPGIKQAVDVLKRSSSPNKELYIFSDMQKTGWEAKAAPLKQALTDFHEKGVLYLVRCGNKIPHNVAIVEVVPQSSNAKPGERVGFAVMVRNTGNDTVKNLTVSLNVDDRPKDEESQPIAAINPGETRIVTLSGKIDKAGLRVVKATVKQDDLEADNTLHQVIQVRDQLRVLAIDGGANEKEPDKASSYYFLHNLALLGDPVKGSYNLRVKVTTPRQTSSEFLKGADLCIFFNVGVERDPKRSFEVLPEKFAEDLGKWVRQGGGLLVFGGDNVMPDAYNRILGKQEGLLPLPISGVRTETYLKPLFFNRKSATAPAFFRIRDDDDYNVMDNKLGVVKTLEFAEPVKEAVDGKDEKEKADATKKAEALRVVMRYSNDKPALVSRKVGAGEVLFVGTSADSGSKPKSTEPTWNDFKAWQTYIGFIDSCVVHLLARQTQNHNFTAGEALQYIADDKLAETSFTLIKPNRDRVSLGKPQAVEGRYVVNAGTLPHAGVYYLVHTDSAEAQANADDDGQKLQVPSKAITRELPFAIQADPRETVNLASMSTEELNLFCGFKPIHVQATATATAFTGGERTTQEWTLWVLAAVLLLALGETVLAWFCGRAW